MMIQDVCELSSLLQNHDMKKSYLEKKLLSLDSTILTQNHRVNKYQIQIIIINLFYIIILFTTITIFPFFTVTT